MIAVLITYILVANGLGHYFLKKGALKDGGLLNKYVLLGYGLFGTVAIVVFYLVTQIPLKHIAVIMALHFVIAYGVAVFAFKESSNKWSLLGVSFTIAGTLIFYL